MGAIIARSWSPSSESRSRPERTSTSRPPSRASAGSTSEPRTATWIPGCARGGSTLTDCQGFCERCHDYAGVTTRCWDCHDGHGDATNLAMIGSDTLRDAEETYPASWIEEALRIAVENNVRKWRYVQAILEDWRTRGRDEREDRGDSEKARRRYVEGEFADFIEH